MKKILILILFTSFAYGQELTVTPYASGPLYLPSKGNFEWYSVGATFQYDKYKLGYGHSRLFGNFLSTGWYLPKQKINLSYTYYYDNPYRDINHWGSWLTVSKKITIFKRKKK